MITINTHEAKSKLSALLATVEPGREEMIICRNGKPVAKLVSVGARPGGPLSRNPRLGPVVFHEDPCSPLYEEAWPEEFRCWSCCVCGRVRRHRRKNWNDWCEDTSTRGRDCRGR